MILRDLQCSWAQNGNVIFAIYIVIEVIGIFDKEMWMFLG